MVTATVQPDPGELGNRGANYQPAANAEASIMVRDNDDPTVIISTLNIPDPSAVPGTPATTSGTVTEGEAVLFLLTASESQMTNRVVNLRLDEFGDYLSGTAASSSGGTDEMVTLTPVNTPDSRRHTARVTIAPGQLQATLSLGTTDDRVSEPHGLVQATVANGRDYRAGTPDQAEVQLRDNELALLTLADASATEGEELAFVVTLTHPPATAVTLQYTISDGTSTPSDYSVDLSPGQMQLGPECH